MSNEWKYHTYVQNVDAYRTGWRGVWDAVVAAITGEPRITFEQPVQISFWAKGSELYIAGAQVEVQDQK